MSSPACQPGASLNPANTSPPSRITPLWMDSVATREHRQQFARRTDRGCGHIDVAPDEQCLDIRGADVRESPAPQTIGQPPESAAIAHSSDDIDHPMFVPGGSKAVV